MKHYCIRKLEVNFWLDVLDFFSDDIIENADEAIASKISSGELKVILPAVFCLIEKKTNGREQRIGKDVIIGRNA